MKQELAQRLLSATLKWSDEEVEEYRELLDDFSELKYDQYQQYKPSSRFVENLCIWLNRFEPVERRLALNFILNNLVFISPAEMQHLVNSSYEEVVVPIIKKQVDAVINELGGKVENFDDIVEVLLGKSLFMAMSDGARIDVFRRFSKLDHDQVCVSYDLSDAKFVEINSEMVKRTDERLKKKSLSMPKLQTECFQNVFLLDDFSGSGVSYLRLEDGEWKGKIVRALKDLKAHKIIRDSAEYVPEIHIILYLITSKAYKALQENIEEFCQEKNVSIKVHYLQMIEPVKPTEEEEAWLKKYYDPSIEDSHYQKGNMDRPHHGFDGCALALVIYHNTPNNSFPILWAGEKALFPRVTRHKDVKA